MTARKAFKATIPVMAGYIVLGIGFGVLLKDAGFGLGWAFFMSLFIYAGSMQYVMIGLMTGGASLITVALTTLMVNGRHLFYGISMLEEYRKVGKSKIYSIFALSDETYSLVCQIPEEIPEGDRGKYYFLVSLFDQCYWLIGSLTGSILGAVIPFDSTGIDFSLTALFISVFVEQWMKERNHLPAIIGVVSTVIARVCFGVDNFLIPAMIIISVLLFTCKRFAIKEAEDAK